MKVQTSVRYKFNRLPHGLNLSSEVFQEKISNLLEGVEGVSVYVDDILCYGTNLKQQHDDHRDLGMKILNKTKTSVS